LAYDSDDSLDSVSEDFSAVANRLPAGGGLAAQFIAIVTRDISHGVTRNH